MSRRWVRPWRNHQSVTVTCIHQVISWPKYGTNVSLKSQKIVSACLKNPTLNLLTQINNTKHLFITVVVCSIQLKTYEQNRLKIKYVTAHTTGPVSTGNKIFCPHSLNWSRFCLSSSPHWCIIAEEECDQISTFSRSAVFPFWVPNLFLHAILTSTEQAETLGKRSFTLRHALGVYDSSN